MSILVDVAEARERHHVGLIYRDEDGHRLALVHGSFGPVGPDQPADRTRIITAAWRGSEESTP